MTTQHKLYFAAVMAVVLAVGIFGGHLWSSYRTAQMEHEIEAAKSAALVIQLTADRNEKEAQGYRAKIEYLEEELSEIRSLATKQDEELKNLKTTTGDARRDVERARSVRSVAVTNEELCRRLAEVGYPCK